MMNLACASHPSFTTSPFCVFVFFVISGYLVTESWCRTPLPGQGHRHQDRQAPRHHQL